MSLVLPSTVEELNYIQNSLECPAAQHVSLYVNDSSKDFENIVVSRYKREFSLPNGVQWNIDDFESYLTFDNNNFEVNESRKDKARQISSTSVDRLVPGEELRFRSGSFSSVSSNTMEDYNMGVKTFNTVCMDSGSTCISSEDYVTPPVFQDLESEETFQNLNSYVTQQPELQADTISTSSFSSASSPVNESLEYSVLNNFSMMSNNSEDSFCEKSASLKRSAASPDDLFMMNPAKRLCESPDVNRYLEVRKKNNIASKNCRKTRKEKQKEMELRVSELEKEREELNKQINWLTATIAIHKKQIGVILHRNNRLT